MKKCSLKVALIVVIASLLLSMVGTAMVRTNCWSVKETRFIGSLKEVADMIRDNNAKSGREVDILFGEDENAQFAMTSYIPKNATAENPAPVIIGGHGYNNNQQMQMENIVELTRRGFIVVTFDLGGHGRTDVTVNDSTKSPAGSDTEGAVAAVEYAMSLPMADTSRVGIIGHSAGDLALANTLNWINTDASKDHIDAFFCPTGTISTLFVNPAALEGDLILGIASGKYDELDTYYFGTADFLGDQSKYNPVFGFVSPAFLVSRYYPGIMGQTVTEGQYYGANGPITIPGNGQRMSEKHAVVVYNPSVTHVQGTYSKEAADLAIEFFYNAFGSPNGKYIKGSRQVWQWANVFEAIGLFGFFASAIVFGAALLESDLFKSLKKEPKAQEELPSIRTWKEIVPLIVTFVPLFLMTQLYFKCFAAGEHLLDGAIYNMPTANGPAWFTLVCGVITFGMILVNYLVKKLCHLGDKEKVEFPLSVAKVDNMETFMKTIGFALSVVGLMYIPVYIAYKVFGMDFGLSVYVAGLPRYQWLPVILCRYLKFWLVYMVANAIVNNMARFKDVPEWASTLFVTVANVLPVIIMIAINYTHLLKNGLTKYAFGDPSIMSWNLLCPMVFIGISGRWFYKKTGNSWAGAFINALIVCLMATTITRHTGTFMFF